MKNINNPTFIRTREPLIKTAEIIAKLLVEKIKSRQSIVLFLSGGSAISVLPKLQELLSIQKNVHQLTVTLVDERYGKPGHADSNEQQISQTGFIDWLTQRGGSWVSVLTGLQQNDEAVRMDRLHRQWRTEHRVLIGLFGAGEDFHTASEMPEVVGKVHYNHHHSEEKYYAAISLDPSYSNPYQIRFGLTKKAISLFNYRVLVLKGEKKLPIVKKLRSKRIDHQQFPVQVLQDAKTTVVFGA